MTAAEYKAACDRLGHSPEELAGLLGIGRATLFRRWNGTAKITAEIALAIGALKPVKRPPKKG
jgi:plasmid maintenance system antidote protein VapI